MNRNWSNEKANRPYILRHTYALDRIFEMLK